MAARLSDEERAARAEAKEKAQKQRQVAKTAREGRKQGQANVENSWLLMQNARPSSVESIKTDNIDRRQLRHRNSGPARTPGNPYVPPFAEHRGVEEVLMVARRAAKKTYTGDASRLASVRATLNHAAAHLETAGSLHKTGNYPEAHAALTTAANSLNTAVRVIDKDNGGGATAVHLSNALQNHLNSYRDQYL
jgi:hypothetical protein